MQSLRRVFINGYIEGCSLASVRCAVPLGNCRACNADMQHSSPMLHFYFCCNFSWTVQTDYGYGKLSPWRDVVLSHCFREVEENTMLDYSISLYNSLWFPFISPKSASVAGKGSYSVLTFFFFCLPWGLRGCWGYFTPYWVEKVWFTINWVLKDKGNFLQIGVLWHCLLSLLVVPIPSLFFFALSVWVTSWSHPCITS